MNVTVIGGGVIGLCCAYYLKKEGFSVHVMDRGDMTRGCSFGNMGYVSPSHFIPLASPGIVSQGLKWMLNSSSPFYIKPRINWGLVRWGLHFWKSANALKASTNARHLFQLLRITRELMRELKADLGDSFPMIEKGCWMLYQSEKAGEHERELARQAEKLGLKARVCHPSEIRTLEPEVEVNAAGGVLYLDDCHLDPALFMRAMYSRLESEGVVFSLNTEVKGFETGKGRVAAVITGREKVNCDQLVIANGSWMPEIAKRLGVKLLMQPGKGYSMDFPDCKKNLHHPAILIEYRTAVTPIDRWLRIGGTMELSGHSDNILPKRVWAIYRAFKKYFPGMEIPQPDMNKVWFGYRPVTPDGMPYIGPHNRFSNLYFAGGHAMLGVSAAAGTGKLITEFIRGVPASIDVSAFAPGRFS